MPCNATVLAASRAGTLGFGVSDAGWLVPWYLGVFAILQKLGIIQPGNTPIGAVSGGSLAAASSCLGLDYYRDTMPVVHAAAAACREDAFCAGTLAEKLTPRWKQLFVPASTPKALATCSSNTYIYISEGTPLRSPRSVPKRIDTHSPHGFADGIVATWHIPFWSNGTAPTTTYRGQPAYEGFYSLDMPCPPGASVCIRLSSRHPGPLMPKQSRLESTVSTIKGRAFQYDPPTPAEGDIHPGLFNYCKYTPMDLGYKLALLPGTRADLEYLFALGQADAKSWADSVGLTDSSCLNPARVHG